jgi:hypothetical protein
VNERFNLAAIIEELEEQKKMIMSVAQSAKKDFLHTMEDDQDNSEKIDADEVKMKAIVVNLKLMEELEEIQQMLSDFGEQTQELVGVSQDDLQKSWDSAKKVMAKAEDKVAEIIKK